MDNPMEYISLVVSGARYAMIDGNLKEEPVPQITIDAWLRSIEEAIRIVDNYMSLKTEDN